MSTCCDFFSWPKFLMKFGTLSQPGKLGLVSSEHHFKASQRKDSYGTILADLCRVVEVTWGYFRTVCLCNSYAGKIRNLGALFKVIQSAIGSESTVSQTPPKQSIHKCKWLLQTVSGNSPCHKNVPVDSSVSEKACRRSLRSAVGSGQK